MINACVINTQHDLHTTSNMPHCVVCEKTAHSRCGGCAYYNYCSKTCQKKHWKCGHRYTCKVTMCASVSGSDRVFKYIVGVMSISPETQARPNDIKVCDTRQEMKVWMDHAISLHHGLRDTCTTDGSGFLFSCCTLSDRSVSFEMFQRDIMASGYLIDRHKPPDFKTCDFTEFNEWAIGLVVENVGYILPLYQFLDVFKQMLKTNRLPYTTHQCWICLDEINGSTGGADIWACGHPLCLECTKQARQNHVIRCGMCRKERVENPICGDRGTNPIHLYGK